MPEEAPLILIVEDEIVLATGLEVLFEDAGYRTAVAMTAAEVGDALARHTPTLALVDLRLRDGMTGPDVTRRLHALGVPVIIHSGEPTHVEDLPAVAYLRKPIPYDRMLAEVRRAIGDRADD